MFKVKIKQDTIIESPREDDNIGTMVCWHKRYNLGDEQPDINAEEWRSYMWSEYGSETEKKEIYLAWANITNRTIDEIEEAHASYTISEMIVEFDLVHPTKDLPDVIEALPLYLYDHSGITMNTTGFSCSWDSGQVGWIYVNIFDDGVPKGDDYIEETHKILKAEVATYDQYLTGDVWGYEIVDDNDEVHDSCWGMYGRAYCEQEAEAARKHLAATVPQTITPTRETA